MPDYDVLTYREISSDDEFTLGPADSQGLGAEGYYIVESGPPIHSGKAATLVVAFGKRPMPEIKAMLERLN
jgi:hypothetical protein